MRQILYLLALAVCLGNIAADPFNPTRTVVMPKQVREVEYSPDQKIFAVSTPQTLTLYEGITFKEIKTINYPADLVQSSLSFSQDESTLAIGFSSDQGTANYAIYSTAKTRQT